MASKDNNYEDQSSVIETPPHLGGLFVSDKKAIVFDDESRFLVNSVHAPAHYIKNEVAGKIRGLGLLNLYATAYPKDEQEFKMKVWFSDQYRAETEDEVRAALGSIWHVPSLLNIQGSATTESNMVTHKIGSDEEYAPLFANHNFKDVVLKENWKEIKSTSPSSNLKTFSKNEVITFTNCISCKDLETISSNTDETHELVRLASNIQQNEDVFVYDKNVYYKQGRKHVDYTTGYSKALSYKEVDLEKGTMTKPLYYKAISDYNFYIKSYEEKISNLASRNVALLPNINVFLLEELSRDEDETTFHEFVTLNGQIEGEFIDVINEKGEKLKEKSDGGQYFDKWSASYSQLTENDKQVLRNQYKDILMPSILNQKVSEYQFKKSMFPMFLDLEFATDTNSSLADLLKEFDLDGALLKTIVEGSRGEFADEDTRKRIQFFPKNDKLWSFDYMGISNNDDLLEEKVLSGMNSFKFFDDSGWNWLEQYTSKGADIFFGKDTDSFALLAPVDSNYYKSLHKVEMAGQEQFLSKFLMVLFRSRFYQLLKEKTRSFKDILKGEKAYSEVVAYKIEKWSLDNNGNPKENIQNYYYTNTSKLDILKHVDTQFKYGEKYHYRVYSWLAVFGTQYNYKLDEKYQTPAGIQTTQENPWYEAQIKKYEKLEIDVFSQPIVKMIEVPYFSFSTVVLDRPPLAPNVDIIPYKNMRNKFLINLSSNTGEVTEEPIIIQTENGDSDIFAKQYEAQELSVGSKLFFQSDDPTTIFQVFKSIDPPTSYADFEGKMTEYDTSQIKRHGEASSFSVIDNNVISNTKYYYTFRTRDVHGNLSNPSPVYKVEIIDNSGAVYLLVDIFEFEDANKKLKTTKEAQRYVSIIPANDQIIINRDITEKTQIDASQPKSATKMNPTLGVVEDSLFNIGSKKHFKVRLVSKKTGKKIDFNLAFEYEHRNPEVKKLEDIKDNHSATTPN